MAQVTQRERKITLAINVNAAEELPDTAQHIGAFLDTLDQADEYDVDIHVGVNAMGAESPPTQAIGFGVPVEFELDEEESDGLRIQ